MRSERVHWAPTWKHRPGEGYFSACGKLVGTGIVTTARRDLVNCKQCRRSIAREKRLS